MSLLLCLRHGVWNSSDEVCSWHYKHIFVDIVVFTYISHTFTPTMEYFWQGKLGSK